MTTMRTKKDMLKWLRALTFLDPFMGVILKNGQWFLGRAAVDDYEIAIAWKKHRRPRAGECFYNAQKFCMDYREHAYWEGYYLIGGTPIHHAWVVMDDGKVVDFTLEAVLRKARREKTTVDETTPLYYGVNVPRRFIMEHVLAGGSGEPIAEDYLEQEALRKRPRK